MINVENRKGLPITICRKEIGPFESISVNNEDWENEFKARKSVRDCVSVGIINASEIEVKTKQTKKEKEEK